MTNAPDPRRAAPSARPAMRIRLQALADVARQIPVPETWEVAKPMPGVLPKGTPTLAMDQAIEDSYEWARNSGLWSEGLGFLGYPYLAELTQRAEYRRPSEIIAREMTRKWIRLQATGDEDKTEKIEQIKAEMERLDVRGVFRRALEMDGFFGRSHIYLDFGDITDEEAKTPLVLSKVKIDGKLRRLAVIEPMWTYPNQYNSTDPLKPDFYRPQTWFVMGRVAHKTRLLTIVSRELPDMLKPAYSFGGLSLSQMLKPCVDNWLRTRQSVSDAVSNFSIMLLSTNMGEILNGGAAQILLDRAALFNSVRDNNGVMVCDKDTEDLKNVSMPLGGLDKLQAQSQEHQAAVTGIPLVKMFGVTPAGLNASSEGEIQCFNTEMQAAQESTCSRQLKYIIDVIQISLFGEVDPAIGFTWEPLWSLSETELTTARKTEADTDCQLIDHGVIDPSEARARLAADEDSPYAALDLNKEIEAPEEEGDRDDFLAGDAEFNEADHPRAENGQFGTGAATSANQVTEDQKSAGWPLVASG